MENHQENQGADQKTEELFPVADLCDRYSIKKAALYDRINFLQLKSRKVGVKSFLDPDQLAHMDALHEHIAANGTMDGYPVPNLSGLPEEDPEPTPPPVPSTLTEQPQSSALTATEFSTPATLEEPEEQPLSLEFSGQELIENLVQEKAFNQSNSDLEEVDSESQDRAAKRIIAGETLTLLYEATENFTKPGLKNAVDAHRVRCRTARTKGKEGIEGFLSQKVSQILQKTGTSG